MSEFRIGDRVRIIGSGFHGHEDGAEGVVVGYQSDWFDVEVAGDDGQWLIASEMEAL